MKRKFYFLSSLCLSCLWIMFFSYPSYGFESNWTEKKLGKIILKADKAARQKKWPVAIKFGHQIIMASSQLDKENSARHINLLKKVNKYYDKAGRLHEIAPQVEKAYLLSREYLSPTHETTLISRTLYYKILISKKEYQKSIPLIQDNISLYEKSDYDKFRLLHYYKQLYSLYGLTEQYGKEEQALLQYLRLNKKILGHDDEDTKAIIIALAKNYCRQKKQNEFKQLVSAHGLQYYCK